MSHPGAPLAYIIMSLGKRVSSSNWLNFEGGVRTIKEEGASLVLLSLFPIEKSLVPAWYNTAKYQKSRILYLNVIVENSLRYPKDLTGTQDLIQKLLALEKNKEI